MLKPSIYTLSLLLSLSAPTLQAETVTVSTAVAVDEAALLEDAKKAAQALSSRLQTALTTTMQAEGPLAALSVCHEKAPELTQAVSAETGLQVSRVSLKNRNPTLGVANDWQQTVLKQFEERKAAGEAAEQLVYKEVVEHEFRFMKAIPTGANCLMCHGTTIAPAISERIKTLYPEDKATGFQEGDLRGAIVVIKNLTPTAE